MNPAFFMPGTITTHFALSSRSWGIPLSDALSISVSVSVEASSLSATLISRSAANAEVLAEPTIARTQIQCLIFFIVLSFVFLWEAGSNPHPRIALQAPCRTTGKCGTRFCQQLRRCEKKDLRAQ